MAKNACQCADPGCPVHEHVSHCGATAETTVYRIDMEDETGTRMCESCAIDAGKSGLFTEES